ncbi:MAG: hypothetical protein UT55_C0017G0002 [Candidatus Peregrinibacteria bacterium GW2011_GWE2_39_6]|nr:MAG: hypothetical protein UT36_C0004G0022 [Candidatus Peregrinibacteria bacterium GW2011_GWF2_39_17]KKR26106.1 MAG: hypothetical protein UT55_C0017G0002 [Candidatus Peregrinibacteria bacterium GW2011_GWE2_39_6]HCW32691.1 hypothetical protein [Candidatus Peregrinibacteria bacterium]
MDKTIPRYYRLKVIPKSSTTELVEIMSDGTLKIRVAAPPEKGKANAELIKFLSNHFGVLKTAITIVSGKSEPLKLIRITK